MMKSRNSNCALPQDDGIFEIQDVAITKKYSSSSHVYVELNNSLYDYDVSALLINYSSNTRTDLSLVLSKSAENRAPYNKILDYRLPKHKARRNGTVELFVDLYVVEYDSENDSCELVKKKDKKKVAGQYEGSGWEETRFKRN